jgi:hypothetical protein
LEISNESQGCKMVATLKPKHRGSQPFSPLGQNLDPKYSAGQNIDKKALESKSFAILTKLRKSNL